MAFFMLFKIPKSLKKGELQKELCSFGDLRYFSLKPDIKNDSFMFAQVDYIKLYKKDEMLKYLSSQKIECSREKPSRNDNQKTICGKVKQHVQTDIYNPSFYYFKDEAYGKDIEKFKLENTYEDIFKIDNAKTFELTTTYPGLLIGSGYNHPKLKENNDDFQLGFFFDHTTGMPVISGSSIKGAIRSIFPDENDRYYEQKIEFLGEEYGIIDIETTIKELFENGNIIFHDAYIIDSKNSGKKIFGSDYITSHHSDEEMGAFKEPNPVKFLKILPEVTFRFQFQANQHEDKIELFEKIILDFGIGAKTNVGYGQFKK